MTDFEKARRTVGFNVPSAAAGVDSSPARTAACTASIVVPLDSATFVGDSPVTPGDNLQSSLVRFWQTGAHLEVLSSSSSLCIVFVFFFMGPLDKGPS